MDNYLNQVRDYLYALQNGSYQPKTEFEKLKTHMMEMLMLMKEGLGDLALTEDTHFEAGGLKTRIKFADKKTYEIKITEVSE